MLAAAFQSPGPDTRRRGAYRKRAAASIRMKTCALRQRGKRMTFHSRKRHARLETRAFISRRQLMRVSNQQSLDSGSGIQDQGFRMSDEGVVGGFGFPGRLGPWGGGPHGLPANFGHSPLGPPVPPPPTGLLGSPGSSGGGQCTCSVMQSPGSTYAPNGSTNVTGLFSA